MTAEVAAGATLRWLPEPGVAAKGCRHGNETQLLLDDGAEVTWREEVVLGRHGEPGGEWRSLVDATLGGKPLLYQDTLIGGPDWASPAVGSGARATGSLLLVGSEAPTEPSVLAGTPSAGMTGASPAGTTDDRPAGRAVAMPLAQPGAALVTALARDARTLRHLLNPATLDLIPTGQPGVAPPSSGNPSPRST